MSTTKQVKVDNWGVFFLQRLKHFFNKTDYCDLTLQFQDYAQLKVHRLVLNACTEYFELLERTCEMYDDCLIMPDDLQVDVVVPIINFMYTGQLEYEYSLYDRLYSTAQIMNMSVLTKLLDAQKGEPSPVKQPKKDYIVMNEHLGDKQIFTKVSGNDMTAFAKKKMFNRRQYGGPGLKLEPSIKTIPSVRAPAKPKVDSPRPTRYEVPEELENEDIFETSFADISYESRPLMKPIVKREFGQEGVTRNIYDEASCSRKFEELQRSTAYKRPRSSSSDAQDGKQIDLDQVNEYAYQQKIRADYHGQDEHSDEEIFDSLNINFDKDSGSQPKEDSNYLFSQISDSSPKAKVIKTNNPKDTFNHAKIISEVLKKYPHLVKNNKNIKLKIMSGGNKPQLSPKITGKTFITTNQQKRFLGNSSKGSHEEEAKPDWTYVSKNMNSEAMAKLVAMGAANVSGPWLCLMCGTPGKALNFSTYNLYYQHLVTAHNEKISANICEYCGYKSGKRNHLLHHLYTKHGVPPPSTHSFPKCNQCPYIALTEAFLIKHKLSHMDNREFCCNVCNQQFRTRSQMLFHIQVSGHKISPDRKASNQCVYCNKIFLRETNLYTHLKLAHKEMARKDGIIDNSDEEDAFEDDLKYADGGKQYAPHSQEEHVSIKQEYDGKIQIISNVALNKQRSSQKILNNHLINKAALEQARKPYSPLKRMNREDSILQIMEQSDEPVGNVPAGMSSSLGLGDRFVVLNDNEYILSSDQAETIQQTIGHVQVDLNNEHANMMLSDSQGEEFPNHASLELNLPQQSLTSQIMSGKIVTTSQNVQPVRSYISNSNQPIQIVVSGNQEYKAIVSTAPIVYSTSSEMKTCETTSTSKYIQSLDDSVQLQNTPEGTVMVLQDQNFNMECSQEMPTDGSNIVVVYSRPLETNEKEYVRVQLDESQESESPTERQEEHAEPDGVLSEQGVVHETVETWQEEGGELPQEDVQETAECSDDVAIHQEVLLTEEEKVTSAEDTAAISEEMPCDDMQISTEENTHIVESEPHEVEITGIDPETQTTENDLTENANISEEDLQDPNIDGVLSSTDQENVTIESIGEVYSTPQDEVDMVQQDNVILMETDEVTEAVVHSEDINMEDEVAVESTGVQETLENIENKNSVDWSDDDAALRKDSLQDLEDADTIPREEAQEQQPAEVEESIENIEKEVQKHILAKERDSDLQNDAEPQITQYPEEEQNNQIVITEESVEDNGHHVDISPTSDNIVNTSTLKQKTVEKISNLLNDWEDNDSQAEDSMETEEVKSAPAVPKQPSIHKLVSDWDDDEDEK